jgi:hypothetical protein
VDSRNDRQDPIWYLDKVLFIIACTYLVLVIVWLVSQDKLRIPFVSKPQTPSLAQKKELSPSDAEFIAYLERSLETIERKAKAERENPSPTAPAASVVPIPQTVISSNPPAPPQNAPTIIEKIYVPVYPQSQSPQLPSVTKSSSNPTLSTLPPPPPPSPSTPSGLTPKSNLSPLSDAGSSPKIEKAGLTLVGLLESSDRSSALFSINGTTRRIAPGEAIATSGWTLVSIQDRIAIVYSNGKTRSLEVGQGF